MMNTLRNNAENSTAKIKDTHSDKIDNLSQELQQLRRGVPLTDQMKLGFDQTNLHRGKTLIKAEQINFAYDDKNIWKKPLDIVITSGERILISGENGSGKTTLIKLLLGGLQISEGIIERADYYSVYIDQDYSMIDHSLNVIQQAESFNLLPLPEHEVKTILNRFCLGKKHGINPVVY